MINYSFEPVVDVSVFNRRDILQYFSYRFTSDIKLGSLLNNLMSPAFEFPRFERLIGWIGDDDYIDNNFYYKISEPTPDRQHYQLAPFIISMDDSNQVQSAVHYLDIFNNLRSQGALTNNVNRLVTTETKSWCPPINPDMLINFANYVWSPLGTKIYETHQPTDILNQIIGKKNASIVLDTTHTEVDENVDSPTYGNSIEVHDILKLQTGHRVRFYNDVNENFNNIVYLVDCVGREIILQDDREFGDIYEISSYNDLVNEERVESTKIYAVTGTSEMYKWSNSEGDWKPYVVKELIVPDYITIERQCEDYNEWSRNNRWFNLDLINNNAIYYRENSTKANHQIIQFNRNKKLFNCGTKKIIDVDCYYEGSPNDLTGKQQGYHIPNEDNFELYDGMKIMVYDNTLNTQLETIYEVSGMEFGISTLATIDIEWENNQEVYIKKGYKKGLYYYNSDNVEFIKAQDKESNWNNYKVSYPLFELYDEDYVSLSSEIMYPNNTFHGSRLFGYKDKTYTEYINYMYYDLNEKDGYFYDYSKDTYESFLLESSRPIESHYVQYFMVSDPRIKQYALEIVPDEIVKVSINTQEIDSNLYSFAPPIVVINKDLKINDIIKIEFRYNGSDTDNLQNAFMEISKSVTTTPTNESIEDIEYSMLLSQMVDIISSQPSFEGNPYYQNNYSSSEQDITLGRKLFVSYSRFNKLAIINNMEGVDVKSIILKIAEKFEEFKRRFIQRADFISNKGDFIEEDTGIYTSVVIKILNFLNQGKSEIDPFFNNGVIAEDLIGGNSYIPATPSVLGMIPCVKPRVEGKYLIGHDGSETLLPFGDWRDEAYIELENMIYDSINEEFKESVGTIPLQKYIPGYMKSTDYSYEEFIELSSSLFAKWFNAHPNETFSNINYSEDPFTWNWSSCRDFTGNMLLGHYRGIYNYFYGTYRPDKCPWEMLGFFDKPSWWDDTYGEAPYTANNLVMWQDIADGIIRKGKNKGQYDYLKRPYLLDIIPTDEAGNLLPPNLNGITSQTPMYNNAKMSFKYGDGSDAEYDWWQTSEYRYALMCVIYLMKPGFWLEYTWDTLSSKVNMELSNEIHNLYVNKEYQRVIGSAQWVSDFLMIRGISINTLDNLLKNVSVKIGYRVGSYLDTGNLTLKNSKFQTLLPINYNVIQYKSAYFKSVSISSMHIVWADGKYIVYGDDNNEPYFSTLTPDTNANYTYDNSTAIKVFYFKTWENKGEKVQYYTVIDTVQEVYNLIRGYGKYLQSIGFVYDVYDTASQMIVDWDTMAKTFLNWVTSSEREDRDVLTLSPFNILNYDTGYPYTHIHFRNTFGIVDNICSYTNNIWNALDIEGNALLSEDLHVYRQNDGVVIRTTEMKQVAYLHMNVYTQENAIILDSVQDGGFIVYEPKNGEYITNLYIESVRTSVWDGGLFAPGLILNDEQLIYNYTTRAYNFKDYYNIDSITSVEPLGIIAKSITGYTQDILLNNIFANEMSEFNFYNASKLERGSFNVVNALRRLPNMENLNTFEIFSLLEYKYGDICNYKLWEIKADPEWNTNNPQIFTMHTVKSYTDFLELVGNPSVENDILYDCYNDAEHQGYYKAKHLFTPAGYTWNIKLALACDDSLRLPRTIIYCSDSNAPSLYINQMKICMCFGIFDSENIVLESEKLRYGDTYYIEYGYDNNKYYLKWSNDGINYNSVYTEDQYDEHNPNPQVRYASLYIGRIIVEDESLPIDSDLIHGYPWEKGRIILSEYDNSLDYNIKQEKNHLVNNIHIDSENWVKQTEFVSDNRFRKIVDQKFQTYLPYIPLLRMDETQYKIVDKIEHTNLLMNNNIKSTEHILVTFDGGSWDLEQLKIVNHIDQILYDEEVDIYDNEARFKIVEAECNFEVGDLVYIKSGREETEAWDGVQTVLRISEDKTEFTLTVSVQSPDDFHDLSEKPTISVLKSKKFVNMQELVDSDILSLSEDNDLFYIEQDSFDEELGIIDALYKFDSNSSEENHLEKIRQKEVKVDTKLIQQVLLYDEKNPTKFAKFEIFDPFKYCIDLQAQKNIKYLSYYDPAVYSNNKVTNLDTDLDNWTDSHIGEVWWDISNCKYYDYEIEDDEYRANTWGKMVPGSTLRIYEWIKSPVPPSEYIDVVNDETEVDGTLLSGTPYSVMLNGTPVYPYNYRSEFNNTTNESHNWYYFWVENTQYVPNRPNRTLSTSKIVYKINSDMNSISWMSPISVKANVDATFTSSFILSNADGLNDEDNILQIKYELRENEFPLHKDWLYFHKGITPSKYQYHWDKMVDSVAGYDTNWNEVPNLILNDYNKYNNRKRPRQSIFLDKKRAMKSLIQKINDMLIVKNIDTTYIESFDKSNKLVVKVPESKLYEPIEVDDANFIFYIEMSDIYVDGGSELYDFYKKVQTNNSSDVSTWLWEDAEESEYIRFDKESYMNYPDLIMDTYEDMLEYLQRNELDIGTYIYVKQDSNYNNDWTVYEIGEENHFIFYKKQFYKMSDYYELVDWYSPDVANYNVIQKTYDYLTDLQDDINNGNYIPKEGDLVKLRHGNDTKWSIVRYEGTLWITVANEDGTIQITDSVLDIDTSDPLSEESKLYAMIVRNIFTFFE